MIRHRCEGCETPLWSSPTLIGLPIKCEICRHENVVPPEAPAARAGSRRLRRSVMPLVFGLSLAIVVVCAAVGVGAYVLGRSPKTEGPSTPARESSLRLTVVA